MSTLAVLVHGNRRYPKSSSTEMEMRRIGRSLTLNTERISFVDLRHTATSLLLPLIIPSRTLG